MDSEFTEIGKVFPHLWVPEDLRIRFTILSSHRPSWKFKHKILHAIFEGEQMSLTFCFIL